MLIGTAAGPIEAVGAGFAGLAAARAMASIGTSGSAQSAAAAATGFAENAIKQYLDPSIVFNMDPFRNSSAFSGGPIVSSGK
jgi:hypothetical protein